MRRYAAVERTSVLSGHGTGTERILGVDSRNVATRPLTPRLRRRDSSWYAVGTVNQSGVAEARPLQASGSSDAAPRSVAPFGGPRSSWRTIPSVSVTVPRRLALWRDQGVASHAGEPPTALASRGISMFSAITTSPKGSPGEHRPQAGGGPTRERTGPPSDFGPSRRLAGPSGACSTAGRNARPSRRSTRLASRGGLRG